MGTIFGLVHQQLSSIAKDAKVGHQIRNVGHVKKDRHDLDLPRSYNKIVLGSTM
jgi:hypothetical protein